jgi:ribonuclease Y
VIAVLIGVAGAVVLAALWAAVYRKRGAAQIDEARRNADRILEDARKAAESKSKEADLEVKEKLLQMRSDFDRKSQQRNDELKTSEKRLQQKEENLDKKTQQLDTRMAEVEKRDRAIDAREKTLEQREGELGELIEGQRHKLEQVAGLTTDEAKRELIRGIENEAKLDAAQIIKRIETEANEHGNLKARKILGMAIQRMASDYVAENTVSVVDLPSEDMKGRIIGREGRNIRALELATGVDLIVDDTPGAIILSGFDPYRREIAKQAIERLIADGRIHPARIEEVVQKVKDETDDAMRKEGAAVAFELGLHDLHPEIHRLMGRLKYRTSYGQNVLAHSAEVARLAGIMARELGLDAHVAVRAAFVHDIGKAIDREMEGTHLQIGIDFLRKHGESEAVVMAMAAHHMDIDWPSLEAMIVQAADAISAARPGARRDILESYVKRLEKLEGIADSFKGVSKSFALQAGREIRIMVESEKISDEEAIWLSKDIARRIENELEYPGQIKVTVIRETRAVDYAK